MFNIVTGEEYALLAKRSKYWSYKPEVVVGVLDKFQTMAFKVKAHLPLNFGFTAVLVSAWYSIRWLIWDENGKWNCTAINKWLTKPGGKYMAKYFSSRRVELMSQQRLSSCFPRHGFSDSISADIITHSISSYVSFKERVSMLWWGASADLIFSMFVRKGV